jgi:uncharacterized BrkB/YihY/UPF0761 family membrane protein
MKEIIKSSFKSVVLCYFLALLFCGIILGCFLVGTIPTIVLKFTLFSHSSLFYGIPAIITSTVIGAITIALFYVITYELPKGKK